MRSRSLPLVLLACTGAVAAQSTFVVPSANATTGGNAAESTLAIGRPGQTPVRAQYLWNVTDIPIQAGVLQSMDLRAYASLRTSNPPGTLAMTLDMSVGPNSSSTVSSTFASNHGPLVVRAFAGNLNLPLQNSAPAPQPWSVSIPFSTPFPYVPPQAQSLVADFVVTNYTTIGTDSWVFDAAATVYITQGQRFSNGNAQSTCRFSTGSYNNSLSYRQPARGTVWFLSYGSVLPNAITIGVLGTQGVGGTFGGLALPIDLGLVGAPGCSWNVDVALSVPMLSDANGNARWPDIMIPNDPGIVGGQFFDQALIVDPAANAFGAVASWSSRWVVGDATPPEGARVTRTANTGNSPTGTVDSTVVVARFAY